MVQGLGTLNPRPQGLNPEPCTLNPKPLNPKRLSPKYPALNPKPPESGGLLRLSGFLDLWHKVALPGDLNLAEALDVGFRVPVKVLFLQGVLWIPPTVLKGGV